MSRGNVVIIQHYERVLAQLDYIRESVESLAVMARRAEFSDAVFREFTADQLPTLLSDFDDLYAQGLPRSVR